MNEINIPMAVLDFIPVIFCGFTGFFLISAFRRRMTPAQGAFFSAGMIMLVAGGVLKALWKMLYALGICDMTALSEQFFPNQAVAFLLLSISTIGMLAKNKSMTENRTYAAAVPVVTSHLPFIIIMTLGMVTWYIGVAVAAARLRKKNAMILIIVALIVMITHAALGSKFDSANGILHWIAEMQNTVAQLLLMIGARIMYKAAKEESYGY